MNELEFINKYKNMKSLKKICVENGVDVSNFLKGYQKDKRKIIIKEIKKEILEMYNIIIYDTIITGDEDVK